MDERTAVEIKYSKDGPFVEPCVKCDSCQSLLLVADLKKTGMCRHCGNTKVRNVRAMTPTDVQTVKKWVEEGLMDRDWLTLFEPAPELLAEVSAHE